MQGEVVGINTMILAGGGMLGNGGNIGIGFAINSNLARDMFAKLVKNGKVVRGYLGVSVLELDKPKAHALGLEPESGVFVADVPDPETPAGRAGIKAKDVIVSYDGKPVKMPRDLTDAVAATPVGQSVQVDFIREGQPQSVTVKVVERPANLTARFAPAQPDGDQRDDQTAAQQGRLGIQARNVTPEIAQQNKLKVDRGVFVSAVQPDSPAGEAGVRHGDVIHRIDRSEVATVEELSQAVKNLAPGEYMLVVERQGRTLFLTLTLED
jgi:serine protease Do